MQVGPGKIEAGSKTDHISAFWDVMPTFGELVNSEVLEDIDGLSFLPTLLGEEKQENHEFFILGISELSRSASS